MTRLFTGFLMLEAVLIGGWAAVAAIRRRALNRVQVLALMALELLVFAHAATSVTSLARHDAGEPGTHVAYAVGSLLVLPLLVGVPVRLGFPREAGAPGTDPRFVGGITIAPPPSPAGEGGARPGPGPAETTAADRYRASVAVLACLAIVVMLERMWVTWQTGAGR